MSQLNPNLLVAPLLLLMLLLAGCSDPVRHPLGLPFGPSVVRYLDLEFSPALGPVREDLLAVERLEPNGLVLKDEVVEPGDDGSPVFQVPGVPLDEGFLALFHGRDLPRARISGSDYPSCQPGAGAHVYTALGAAPPPPPFGPVTPSAPYPGAPTPTPPPTPSIGPFPADLSPDGLLAAGWPNINLELVQPDYQGVTYRYSSFRYIDQRGSQASIPPDVLEELEVLDITYRVDADLPAPLAPLVTGDPVTDRVRVFRFKDRPASEVIIVDQCPADFQYGQFLFYKAREVELP